MHIVFLTLNLRLELWKLFLYYFFYFRLLEVQVLQLRELELRTACEHFVKYRLDPLEMLLYNSLVDAVLATQDFVEFSLHQHPLLDLFGEFLPVDPRVVLELVLHLLLGHLEVVDDLHLHEVCDSLMLELADDFDVRIVPFFKFKSWSGEHVFHFNHSQLVLFGL